MLLIAEAAGCLVKAVDIYTDMGRFNVAAKHHQTIAEIYESDVADLEKAMHHYEQARRLIEQITRYALVYFS